MIPAPSKPKSIPAPQLQSERLQQLRRILQLNRQSQQKLKHLRNTVRERMKTLQGFIATYRLKIDYPPETAVLSYIKFQRNLPLSYRQQVKITKDPVQLQEKDDNESEFLKKLNQAKQKKKKELDISALPFDSHRANFSLLCKGTQYRTGMQLYRALMDIRRSKEPKRLFTLQEDQLLLEKHVMYGDNWEKITQYFQGRQSDEISYEYNNRVNPFISSGRWTIRQTLMLIILLEHFGCKRWCLIAHKMKVKNELQVRERFCNLIDPLVGKDVWSFELEKKLLEVAEENNYCWKKISTMPCFKNKTDNSIWRKFKSLMIRFSDEEIMQMLPEGKDNRGLGKKILKDKHVYDKRRRAASNPTQPPIYFKDFKPREGAEVVVSSEESMREYSMADKERQGNDFLENSESHFQLRADYQ